jgi:hypothetical protein
MARPKGSVDKKPRAPRRSKKVKTADGRPATTEHNAAHAAEKLSDDERYALLQQAIPRYEDALANKKNYDKRFKDECQRLIALGVTIDAVKYAIKLKTPEGAALAKADLEMQVTVARWMNADIGHQFTLFRDDGEEGTEENASYKAGKESGVLGESTANIPRKWDINEFLRGYGDGQAINLDKFKQKKAEEEQEFESAAPPVTAAPIDLQPPAVAAGVDDDEF